MILAVDDAVSFLLLLFFVLLTLHCCARQFYNEEVRTKPMAPELSKREGKRLLRLLTTVMGDKTQSKVAPQLTPLAKKAFALFYYFVKNDTGFQDALETVSAVQLARLVKLERHMEDPDPEHQRLATALVLFLSSNYLRFQDLTVRASASARVYAACGFVRSVTFNIVFFHSLRVYR